MGLLAGRPDNRVRGWVAMGLSAALLIPLWRMTASGLSYAAAIIVPLMGVFILFWFAYGAGLFVGSLIVRLTQSSPHRMTAIGFVVIAPCLLAFMQAERLEARDEAARLAKFDAREAWRAQTLTGSLGDHAVSFSLQPNLSIQHACRNNQSKCTSSWSGTGLNQTEAEDLNIFELRFRKSRKNAEWLFDWCEAQAETANVVGCDIDQPYDFSFEAEGLRRIPLEEAAYSSLHQAPKEVDLLVCSSLSQVRRCYTIFEIAPGIRAIVYSSGLAPDVTARNAVTLLPAIERSWAVLTQTD